jgi:hypothetical protein
MPAAAAKIVHAVAAVLTAPDEEHDDPAAA